MGMSDSAEWTSANRSIVLVVEDEPILRMFATDMIQGAGFEVVSATNALEAVSILESRLDIRLLFTDVDMHRGTDGLKLAAAVRDRWPPIEIIVVSGHIDCTNVVLPTRSIFFKKPYVPFEIINAMRVLVGI